MPSGVAGAFFSFLMDSLKATQWQTAALGSPGESGARQPIVSVASLPVSRCRIIFGADARGIPEGVCNACYHRDSWAKNSSPGSTSGKTLQPQTSRPGPGKRTARPLCFCSCNCGGRSPNGASPSGEIGTSHVPAHFGSATSRHEETPLGGYEPVGDDSSKVRARPAQATPARVGAPVGGLRLGGNVLSIDNVPPPNNAPPLRVLGAEMPQEHGGGTAEPRGNATLENSVMTRAGISGGGTAPRRGRPLDCGHPAGGLGHAVDGDTIAGRARPLSVSPSDGPAAAVTSTVRIAAALTRSRAGPVTVAEGPSEGRGWWAYPSGTSFS